MEIISNSTLTINIFAWSNPLNINHTNIHIIYLYVHNINCLFHVIITK